MADRESRLLAIAEALSDGTPVDWAAAESRADNEGEREQIRRLRQIHDVTGLQAGSTGVRGSGDDLHDSLLHPSAAVDADATEETPVAWGPLRVIEKIGRGRFGDVYRAWDPRLDREVALKLLRHRESDRDGVAVIDEGRLLAKVRHPNVATVYGAERIEGRVGVWMELVRGRTLEEELQAKGPSPPSEAAAVGVDVCRALAAVHRAGLLHRDVKAQNVMRGEDGRIVLMDFGTGREIETATAVELAGTPLYLAPELLDGAPATPQSDLYSAGVLVYHLATGSFPVRGRTLHEVREAHARWRTAARPPGSDGVPPSLAPLLERALARRPDDRFSSADEMAGTLETIVSGRPMPVRRSNNRSAALGGLGIAVATAVVGWNLWQGGQRGVGMAAALVPRLVCEDCGGESSSIDRDGRSIASFESDGRRIAIRTLATGAVTHLQAAPDVKASGTGLFVAFSPDARRLAYLWAGPDAMELRTLATQPGVPSERLWTGAGRVPWPLDWSADGQSILAAVDNDDRTSDLAWIAAATGVQTMMEPLQWRAVPGRPSVSPDGRFVAYSALPVNPDRPPPNLNRGSPLPAQPREQRIYIRAADGSRKVELITTAAVHKGPVWSPDGRKVLFISNQSGTFDLWIVPVENGQAAGPPEVVRRDIGNVGPLTLSRSGTYFYSQSHPAVLQASIASLAGAGVQGAPRTIIGALATWSPDGRFLALIRRRPPAADAIDVIVHEIETGSERVFSHEGVANGPPIWFGDGKGLLVASSAPDEQRWSRIDLETGEIQRLARNRGNPKILTHWGIKTLVPDGRTLVIGAYDESEGGGGPLTRIMALEFASERYREVLRLPGDPAGLPRAASDLAVAISPDGRSVAVLATDPRTRLARLARVELDGTGYRELCPPFAVPGIRETLVWTSNGILAAAADVEVPRISKIVRVPAEGGPPEFTGLTVPALSTLSASPDGSQVVSWQISRTARTELWSLDLSPVLKPSR